MNDVLKSSLINIAKKQIMGLLIEKAPFFAFGPLNAFIGFILGWILGIVMDKTIIGIKIAMIDSNIKEDVSKINDLLDKIKSIPEVNKDERDKIENDIITHTRDLVRLNISRLQP
jgi:hypothetical protein